MPLRPSPKAAPQALHKKRAPRAQEAEASAKKQLDKAMDLLERDVYSIEMFQQRATSLNEKIAMSRRDAKELTAKIQELERKSIDREAVIARWERVLKEYPQVEEPAVKNALLKEILERVEYSKPQKGTRGGGMDNFAIKIFPRL